LNAGFSPLVQLLVEEKSKFERAAATCIDALRQFVEHDARRNQVDAKVEFAAEFACDPRVLT